MKSPKSKRLYHVSKFIMAKCALLKASKSIFDRSSPLGHSRDKRDFGEIFLTKSENEILVTL